MQIVGREVPGAPLAAGPFRHAAHAILRYDVFPKRLLTPVLERTPLQVGDTVGARYHLLPGFDLFFASRVIDVFDTLDETRGVHRAGFTYRTLSGHPEFGEETFSATKELASGDVSVELRAWSRPGNWATRLAWRWARRIQVRASNAALEHLQHAANEFAV